MHTYTLYSKFIFSFPVSLNWNLRSDQTGLDVRWPHPDRLTSGGRRQPVPPSAWQQRWNATVTYCCGVFMAYVKAIFSVWIRSVREEKVQSGIFSGLCLTGSVWQPMAAGAPPQMRYLSALGRLLLFHNGFIFSIRDYNSFTLTVFVICAVEPDAVAVISAFQTLVDEIVTLFLCFTYVPPNRVVDTTETCTKTYSCISWWWISWMVPIKSQSNSCGAEWPS